MKGIKPAVTKCTKVSVHKLKGLLKNHAVTHCVHLQALSPAADHDNSVLTVAHTVESNTPGSVKLPDSVPPPVQELVQQYKQLFQDTQSLPPSRSFDHRIPLVPGASAINVRPYRYAPHQKTQIERQVQEMLQKGIIQRSISSFASPVLLVKKKDGTWRFCVDYRQLNAITVKDKHPLLVVDELLDELHGAKWFSKLDCRSGYHQIRVAVGDEMKTAFNTHHGLYEFKIMPFGLTNAPATFQCAMNELFAPLLRKGVLVFMDDILVYSSTLDHHIELLQQVFSILQKHEFYLKLSKCECAKKELEYLGHIVSELGVATEQTKVSAVQSWPVPQSVKVLRGFLGLTGYYRRFIRHYGMVTKPLTQLLKKGIPFLWTPTTQEAFEVLKRALQEAPVLAMPDYQKPFIIETDASDVGIGAVLMQEGHPISYLSKALCPKNKALSSYEKECMAILLAVEKWSSYLLGREFIIRTDHKSLSYLTEHKATTQL